MVLTAESAVDDLWQIFEYVTTNGHLPKLQVDRNVLQMADNYRFTIFLEPPCIVLHRKIIHILKGYKFVVEAWQKSLVSNVTPNPNPMRHGNWHNIGDPLH